MKIYAQSRKESFLVASEDGYIFSHWYSKNKQPINVLDIVINDRNLNFKIILEF